MATINVICDDFFKYFSGIAPLLKNPLVLAGFFALLFFSILALIIKKGLVPKLTKKLGADIIKKILLYGFILSLTALILGFIWVITNTLINGTNTKNKGIVFDGPSRISSMYSDKNCFTDKVYMSKYRLGFAIKDNYIGAKQFDLIPYPEGAYFVSYTTDENSKNNVAIEPQRTEASRFHKNRVYIQSLKVTANSSGKEDKFGMTMDVCHTNTLNKIKVIPHQE